MRIFHISSKESLEEIKSSGEIKTNPQFVGSYNEYGEEITEVEDRVYFCTDEEAAQDIASSFEYYRGGDWEIAEFEADVDDPQPDPKSKGWFSRKSIKI